MQSGLILGGPALIWDCFTAGKKSSEDGFGDKADERSKAVLKQILKGIRNFRRLRSIKYRDLEWVRPESIEEKGTVDNRQLSGMGKWFIGKDY
jgi:hypothetical protein